MNLVLRMSRSSLEADHQRVRCDFLVRREVYTRICRNTKPRRPGAKRIQTSTEVALVIFYSPGVCRVRWL